VPLTWLIGEPNTDFPSKQKLETTIMLASVQN